MTPTFKEARDRAADACANSFYHAQGSIEQVMPWSDCKESFQKGADWGYEQGRAEKRDTTHDESVIGLLHAEVKRLEQELAEMQAEVIALEAALDFAKECVHQSYPDHPVTKANLKSIDQLAYGNANVKGRQDKIERLERELNEERRLNGMGQERELKLIAEVERLTKERDELRKTSPSERTPEGAKAEVRELRDYMPQIALTHRAKILAMLDAYERLTADHEDDWRRIQDAEREVERLTAENKNLAMVCRRLAAAKTLEIRDRIAKQCHHLFAGSILRDAELAKRQGEPVRPTVEQVVKLTEQLSSAELRALGDRLSMVSGSAKRKKQMLSWTCPSCRTKHREIDECPKSWSEPEPTEPLPSEPASNAGAGSTVGEVLSRTNISNSMGAEAREWKLVREMLYDEVGYRAVPVAEDRSLHEPEETIRVIEKSAYDALKRDMEEVKLKWLNQPLKDFELEAVVQKTQVELAEKERDALKRERDRWKEMAGKLAGALEWYAEFDSEGTVNDETCNLGERARVALAEFEALNYLK